MGDHLDIVLTLDVRFLEVQEVALILANDPSKVGTKDALHRRIGVGVVAIEILGVGRSVA